MALSNCRECGKQVSTEASACPHCGAPQSAPSTLSKVFSAYQKASMVPCKTCKAQVDPSAKKCPHCGVSNPGWTVRNALFTFAGLGALVLVLVVSCSDSEAEKQAKVQAKAQAEAQAEAAAKAKAAAEAEAAAQARAKEEAACKADLQCLGDKASIVAAQPCAHQIERFAKYEVIWTEGTFGMKFPRFRWFDQKSAKITLIGDSLQFTNGFNAKVPIRYLCHVDMSGDTPVVIDVVVNEGRW